MAIDTRLRALADRLPPGHPARTAALARLGITEDDASRARSIEGVETPVDWDDEFPWPERRAVLDELATARRTWEGAVLRVLESGGGLTSAEIVRRTAGETGTDAAYGRIVGQTLWGLAASGRVSVWGDEGRWWR